MKKTFKEYYADPEYKERHLAYLNEKVECECGLVTARNYLWKHRKTNKHKKKIDKKCNNELKLKEEEEEENTLPTMTEEEEKMFLMDSLPMMNGKKPSRVVVVYEYD
eukprot:Pompholyxophrys_sp_v1_NODE_6_length_8036_cov_9.951134.p6 type:complete len:107 gc:universal NODE_6_length_8036_cov_9.951134:1824-1504(-)